MLSSLPLTTMPFTHVCSPVIRGVEYVYNTKGQLTQTRQNGQVLSEFTYDSNGNLSKKTDY